jgi:hypothetical protein
VDQLGTNLDQLGADLGQLAPNFGQLNRILHQLGLIWYQLGLTWSGLEPTWDQLGSTFDQLGCKIGQLRTKMALNCTILNKVDHLICENSLFFFGNLYVLRMSALMQSLANLGPPWTNFYPTWGILGVNLDQLGANLG